jgi:hypothetical protein
VAEDPAAADLVGIVLAGGQSSRMGAEKGLLPLGGVPLIERAVARLRPQVEKVVISANGDPARFQSCAVRFLPTSRLVADRLEACSPAFDGLVRPRPLRPKVACATPFFPLDLADRLARSIALSNGHDRLRFGEHLQHRLYAPCRHTPGALRPNDGSQLIRAGAGDNPCSCSWLKSQRSGRSCVRPVRSAAMRGRAPEEHGFL